MKVLKRGTHRIMGHDPDTASIVSEMLLDLERNGMDAVRKYSAQFDQWNPKSFEPTTTEIQSGIDSLPAQVIADTDFCQANVRRFAAAQLTTMGPLEVEIQPGVVLGHKHIPVNAVGSYIPGGRYPMFGSAQMSIIPAKVAGVKNVVACTPPVKGEGFFIACFRKNGGNDEEGCLPKIKPEKFSVREMEILNKNVNTEGLTFLRHGEIIYAVPEKLLADMNFLSSNLRVVNCGTKVGEIIKDKLIPDHALALGNLVSDKIQKVELDHNQAIQYLKKKELSLQTNKKGWSLVTYQDHPLGWANILPNRINNYYPKELRILKDLNP